MDVATLIEILGTYPSDMRVVVACNVGYDDVLVVEAPIAAEYHRNHKTKTSEPSPLTYGVHARPDRIFNRIEATESALIITRQPAS